ncbi:uncharacterized protein PHACADRAFT_118172 [Phanerochaete carnosa HHB-10118-sp]|uniref:Uncharacterized protein n=1 Tax=Phanerochaete carnosa (strain HHB-10118-sp) TaxID=650164 RepID=K5WB82_PHACS|nr:uncharacterized protein PHACADRAFT_118172 [Phanerochaete carnosa HHB-10118-sp]EKM56455.1 hypothetical protein PHACADRAFT_118172 [Phanerochaete carnosa HHB-10118-sp]
MKLRHIALIGCKCPCCVGASFKMNDTFRSLQASHGPAYPQAIWQSSPDVRGTYDIISTCLSTIVICVWSAVHVDVPIRQTRWSIIDKIGWLVTGLVAPDLLLYVACCQLYRAYVLLGEAKRCLHVESVQPKPGRSRASAISLFIEAMAHLYKQASRVPEPSDEASFSEYTEADAASAKFREASSDVPLEAQQPSRRRRKHPWTLTHAFYGVMGGFVLETPPILEGETRFVLTLSGLRFVMDNAPDLLPDLSEEEIWSKGRSDALAKVLLMLQLLYFCISCAARLAQSLPLSLLEVTTLAHALCTVVTCVVWWKKPFNVQEPTLIRVTGERATKLANELAAYMLFTSRAHKDYIAGLVWYLCASESSYLEVSSPPPENMGHYEAPDLRHDVYPGKSFLIEGYCFEILRKKPDPHHRIVFGHGCLPWYNCPRGINDAVRLSDEDMYRWILAARGLRKWGDIQLEQKRVLVSRHGGLQMSVFKHGEKAWWPAVSLAIATAYGAVHLIGWKAEFPTLVERTLWRYAAVTLIILGLAFFQYSAISPEKGSLGHRSSQLAFYSCLLFYPLASGYVLIESTRQLFFLPDKAFVLPDLSIYLPHFS